MKKNQMKTSSKVASVFLLAAFAFQFFNDGIIKYALACENNEYHYYETDNPWGSTNAGQYCYDHNNRKIGNHITCIEVPRVSLCDETMNTLCPETATLYHFILSKLS